MATELWIKRRLDHLVPANTQAHEAMEGLPQDEWYLATIRRPRNLGHHKKYMALLQVVYPHQDTWPTFTSFRKALACALGHGLVVKSKDGREIMDADSISFAKMDQDEFQQFYDRAIRLICERILPNVNSEDLEREVGDILSGRKAA
ncbi:MAG: DUF1367 family protein [Pseudomonadota bacterium]